MHLQPRTTLTLLALAMFVIPGIVESESGSSDQRYIFSLSLEELTLISVGPEVIVEDELPEIPPLELARGESTPTMDGRLDTPASKHSQQNIR